MTPTYLVEPRSSKQLRLASQPCDSCVECVVVYQRTFSSLWSCRWFLVGWTMATQCYVHGLPDYQYRCLQSVLHAAARSIYSLRRCEHVTPALIELHWLSAVDRVNFKVATLVYRCLHGLAPPYLSSTLHRVSEVETRRRLRSSADTDILLTPRSRLVTARDRSFSVAGPRIWNDLPETVRAAPSLSSFKRQLKTFLFHRRYS